MSLPTTTVCLIIKDEALYISEWLAHYSALGFDEIVVYDNGSTDGTSEILRRSAPVLGNLTIVDWSNPQSEKPQVAAYCDALSRCETDWIAFYDTDEFLVLHESSSIGEYLSQVPEAVGAIAVNWLLFGSSGEAVYGPEMVTKRFRNCASADWGKNKLFKSIAKVRATRMIDHPHSVHLEPGYHYADAEFSQVSFEEPAKTATITHKGAQLNHYVLRSREEYQDKIRRGNVNLRDSDARKRAKFNEDFWVHHDTNHREDRSIEPWAVKAEPIYRQLLQVCPSAVREGWIEVLRIKEKAAELEKALEERSRLAKEMRELAAQRERQLEQEIAAITDKVRKRDADLAKNSERIGELENRLKERFRELASMTQMLAAMERELKVQQDAISGILSSTSWRVTGPLRKMLDLLRGAHWRTDSADGARRTE